MRRWTCFLGGAGRELGRFWDGKGKGFLLGGVGRREEGEEGGGGGRQVPRLLV